MSMLLELKITADGKIAVSEVDKVSAGVNRSTEAGKKQTQSTREQRNELERYMGSLRKEVETLGMSRAQIRLYEAARMGATQADLRAIEVSNQLIAVQERKTAALAGGMSAVGRSVAGLATAAAALSALKYIGQAADESVLLEARIKLVTRGLQEQQLVQQSLFDTAQQLQVPFMELARGYPRIAMAVREVGGATEDAIALQKIFAETVRLSGASQQEAAASAMQFAQALGSGKLSGDELRSILENNLVLAQAIAKGMGKSVGELRKLGEEGQLTSAKVIRALLSQKDALEREASNLPKTISGAWTVLNNEMERTVAKSVAAASATSILTTSFTQLAGAIRLARDNGVAFAGVPIVGPFMAQMQQVNVPQPNRATGRIGSSGPEDQLKAARDAARRAIRDLTAEAETAEGVNARYEASVARIWDVWGQAAKAGALTAKDQRNLNAQLQAELTKRNLALDALAKKGQPSLESETALIRARYEAQQRESEDHYRALNDITQKGLKQEEFYRAAALTSERQYIDAVAVLHAQQERDEVARLTRDLALAEARKREVEGRKGVGPNERAQHERDVAEETEKVRRAREALTRATGNLGNAEQERGRAQILLDRKILENTIAIEREREDLSRAMRQELMDLEFEIELLGKTEVEQRKLTALRQLEIRYLQDKERLKRRLRDLERNGGSEEELEATRISLETLDRDFARSAERLPELIQEQFNQERLRGVSEALADALLSGGEDGGRRVRDALEDYFKKPIKMQLQAAIQQGMNGLMNGTAQLLGFDSMNAMMSGPVGMGMAINSVLGPALARAMGAGERGQRAAAWSSMLFGSVVGSIIGKLTDPKGLANRSGRFGNDPAGNYSFAGSSAFGRFGTFDDKWFSEDDMGEKMRAFLADQARLENMAASRMSAAERARATAALAGSSREYSFGMEHGDIESLGQIMRDRMAVIVDAALPGLGKLVEAFEGTGAELATFVESIFGLRDSLAELDLLIAQVGGSSVDAVRAQMDALNTQVDRARGDLTAALDAKDPTAILQAERALTAAVMNRYQQEMALVRQLEDAIRQTQEAAYQFQLTIAQRIASVGGTRDVAGISLNRANSLRGSITGNGPVGNRIADINSYVGAIDSWYQSRRSQIEAQMQAEQQAAAAIAQAQQAAANARIAQLQGELEAAEKFREVVERTRDMIDDMRLSSANPASVQARLGMARDDVASLRSQYQSATGARRAELANQLLEALGRYRQLGQEAFQRPSPEWQQIYNELMAELTSVQADAKSEAERAIEIQQRIEKLQAESSRYAGIAANAALRANNYLDALNAEALDYYTWAEEEAKRAYAEQERMHREQLNAITGGMDVELFVAARQAEAVDELRGIRALMAAFLRNGGNTTPPPPGGPPAGNGAGPGAGNNPAQRSGNTITFNVQVPVGSGYAAADIERIVMNTVKAAAPAIRRELARS